MALVMTREWLKQLCREHKQYITPALNDTLHLHFKGFSRIENLEEYTGLKSIFLEGNGLESLDGLQACTELRCVFAQQNCLPRVEHLAHLSKLDTLNLCHNRLTSLEGVQSLPALTSLQVAGNALSDVASLSALSGCPLLSSLDIQDNDLAGDAEALLVLLAALPGLRALYLSSGNPIVSALRPYRKRVVAACKGLVYLDDKPVFDAERRAAEAWARGGEDAERAEREKLAAEKQAATRANFEHITALRAAAKARRRAAAAENGEVISDDERAERASMGSEVDAGGSDSDDSAADVAADVAAEPPELIRARETLAQYAPLQGEEEPIELTHTRAALAAAGRLQPGGGGGCPATLAPWPRGETAEERADLEAMGRAAWGAAEAEDELAHAMAAEAEAPQRGVAWSGEGDAPPLEEGLVHVQRAPATSAAEEKPPAARPRIPADVAAPPREPHDVAPPRARPLIEELPDKPAAADVAAPPAEAPAAAVPLRIEEVEEADTAAPPAPVRLTITELTEDETEVTAPPAPPPVASPAAARRVVVAIEESDADSDDDVAAPAAQQSMADID